MSRSVRRDPLGLVLLSLALGAVLGSLSYALSLGLGLLGFLVVNALGWDWPSWTFALAFVVGMPLGAWIEVYGVRH
jgi:hypothetical protein